MTRISGEWLTRPETQAVARMLTEAGYRSLFVGGCVRDALLGVPVGDVDISTDARPDQVMELARAAGLKPVPTGIDHGTVTVVSGGVPHEITTFRRDVETDGRHAVVAYSDRVEDDARRRDFTMNALYAEPDGTVIDPLNGLPDLRLRRFRFIEDPEMRIREDYLRILRFFRFHAWYGDPAAGLDADALAAIAANVDGIGSLSKERIGGEMRKLLGAPDPAPALAAMAQSGALSHVLPGAAVRAIAPLVHLEQQADVAPDPMRRLAALGGEDPAGALRLSRKETETVDRLRDQIGAVTTAEELGYTYGTDRARDVVLLRAALLELPLDAGALEAAEHGARQTFPVTARDLMPEYQGPALGQRLKELEQHWIASGFSLDREALLAKG